jgi:Acid sphingomyelin phosphodiesterase C-terminal region
MEKFTNIIRGQMFCHTHADNVQVMRGIANTSQISRLAYILHQLTTFKFANPSYRIFELQADNFAITNYYQYRLYIDEANRDNNPNWRIAYIFKDLYEAKSMSYEDFAAAIERIKYNNTLA